MGASTTDFGLFSLFSQNPWKVHFINTVKEIKEDVTFVIDLIAAIQAMTNLPSTYEELVGHFISTLPKCFKRLDIVADTYRTYSIKGGEKNTRGSRQRVIYHYIF